MGVAVNRKLYHPPLRWHLLRLLACSALALPCWHALAEPSQCSLGIPGAPEIRASANASDNAWLAANLAYPVMALGAAPTNAMSTIEADMIGQAPARLKATEAGFAVERIKPQYWLADRIMPPPNVDWDATFELFHSSNPNPNSFFFDAATPALYAALGGAASFTWVLTNGEIEDHIYVIGGASQGRPRRIFWTDWPYQAPAVNLAGKFVKFFGDPNILTPQFGVVTNVAGGISQVLTNKITRGLYIDQTTKQLFAAGELSGQVLMGGNFYGGHIAFAMDGLKAALASAADMCDRQIMLLVNPNVNRGLPGDLVRKNGASQGLHHGFKAMSIASSALAQPTWICWPKTVNCLAR